VTVPPLDGLRRRRFFTPYRLPRGITPPRGLTLAPGGAILARDQGEGERLAAAKGLLEFAQPRRGKNQIEGDIVQTTTLL